MQIDEPMFIAIYDEYASKVYKYCYFRVSSKEDAEDLSSQVFTRAWDYIKAGKEVDNIRAFIFRIAHNLVIDHYRKGKKTISLEDLKQDIPSEDGEKFVGDLDLKLVINQVKEKLDKLPENYQSAVVLRFINDLSVKEVAQIMETSENNVSVIIHRAIIRLKKLI